MIFGEKRRMTEKNNTNKYQIRLIKERRYIFIMSYDGILTKRILGWLLESWGLFTI